MHSAIQKIFSFDGKIFSLVCGNVFGKSVNIIILSIHIILSVWCSLCAFDVFIHLSTLMEFLDALNFLFSYTFCAVTNWIIIYDSCTEQRLKNAFWSLFEQIHDGIFSQNNVEIWSYLSPSICLLSVDILLLTMAVTLEKTTDLFTKTMHFTFNWTYDNRAFFYFLHLKVIAIQLQRIEIEFKRLQINFTQKRLEWIRDHYKLSHDLCEMVNATFGLSNLAMLLLGFHSAVTFVNFIYRQIHRKFDKFSSSS